MVTVPIYYIQFFKETYVQDFEFKLDSLVSIKISGLDAIYKRLKKLWGDGLINRYYLTIIPENCLSPD